MCFYSTYDDFARDEPLHRLELMFVSLKLAVGGKKERNHQFQVGVNTLFVHLHWVVELLSLCTRRAVHTLGGADRARTPLATLSVHV